jgi:NADPH:quinone reductase-like Zn-dependent oxidoreductase
VIATTSTDEKAEFLEKVRANHVIKYKQDQSWGETAKRLSPGKAGADHVVEVRGPTTIEQSMEVVEPEGVIPVIGF